MEKRTNYLEVEVETKEKEDYPDRAYELINNIKVLAENVEILLQEDKDVAAFYELGVIISVSAMNDTVMQVIAGSGDGLKTAIEGLREAVKDFKKRQEA